jgi:hypothetical protein
MAMPYAIVPRELIVSLEADADYTAKQYYLMDIEASTGHAKLVAAAGAVVFGVLLDAPASGVQCRVAYGGIVPCVAGTGGVTAGDLVSAENTGKGITATKSYTNTNDAGSTTDALIGSFVIGRALTTAAAGEQFMLAIQPMAAVPTTAV